MRPSLLAILILLLFSQIIAQKTRAPELIGGVSWLNTESPLSLADLKGKLVLLDFWTYGCINCIHILPDLRRLEEKYANQLVIIGVHSAKYDNEADTENIRRVILRYDIKHPVVNDSDFKIWNAYGVSAYPTLVLIDPDGNIVNRWIGEGQFNQIETEIQRIITEYRARGRLNESPINLTLERAKFGSLPLAFPGKLLADSRTKRLFISDTNHNRIVVTDLDGKLLEIIGDGVEGLKDGSYEAARFSRPQGLTLYGQFLFVADTGNHAIRRVDLKSKVVETVAGNGKQATYPLMGGVAKRVSLSSPWDLVRVGNSLYVAMAGVHQIWKFDLVKNLIFPFAGSGAEGRVDDELSRAAFGQPSGIASDGNFLYIADTETNAIRMVDLRKKEVETLAGGDLFIFGDEDGEGEEARLQHPMGITIYNGKLLIADTYNHKLKLLDIRSKRLETYLGNGKPGQADGNNPTFYEPAGVSIADGKIYVADTNNHAIRVVDTRTKSVYTLKIPGLTPPKQESENFLPLEPNLSVIKHPEEFISSQSEAYIIFDPEFPEGYHLNKNAPNRFEIKVDKPEIINISVEKNRFDEVPLSIAVTAIKEGSATINAKFNVYYCREDNTGVCLIKTLRWEIPIRVVNEKKITRIELRSKLSLN